MCHLFVAMSAGIPSVGDQRFDGHSDDFVSRPVFQHGKNCSNGHGVAAASPEEGDFLFCHFPQRTQIRVSVRAAVWLTGVPEVPDLILMYRKPIMSCSGTMIARLEAAAIVVVTVAISAPWAATGVAVARDMILAP